ncbi:sulfatase-like hydrolase/transferase [Maribacter aquimaris]|uniref:sulfatase-like hydrolase/transferase n=1 Tax=Maribacter aquimaris TaxID=2737171 RepID=UPI0021D0925E|nr:sulfatase-like hydrolase/transferase [Maribacter aquimaris]
MYDFIPGLKKSDDNRDLVHHQANEVTISALLKSVGYATCLVGKWHCSSRFNSDQQPQPNDFGFDYWMATHNNAVPSHKNPKNFVRNGEEVGEIKGFSSQIVVDEAIQWLEKQKGDNPFFLEVAFHEPHEPIAFLIVCMMFLSCTQSKVIELQSPDRSKTITFLSDNRSDAITFHKI